VRALLAESDASVAPYRFIVRDSFRDDDTKTAWQELSSWTDGPLIAALLLERGARPSTIALIGAASASEGAPILRVLLDGGGDARCVYRNGHAFRPPTQTLLHAAAAAGCLASVELLCERGAAIEAVHVTQETKFVKGGKRVTVESRDTALLLAAKGGHADVVAALIERGADAHVRCAEGRTALFYAYAGGCTGAARPTGGARRTSCGGT
jgi:hypothetical protein